MWSQARPISPQATDPATGKQSHSVIYMPAAWLQIGFDYWKNGQSSEEQETQSVAPATLAKFGGAMKASRLSCLRDIRAASALLASGRMSKDKVKEFGIKLLKDTLFHEVGHSLGWRTTSRDRFRLIATTPNPCSPPRSWTTTTTRSSFRPSRPSKPRMAPSWSTTARRLIVSTIKGQTSEIRTRGPHLQ